MISPEMISPEMLYLVGGHGVVALAAVGVAIMCWRRLPGSWSAAAAGAPQQALVTTGVSVAMLWGLLAVVRWPSSSWMHTPIRTGWELAYAVAIGVLGLAVGAIGMAAVVAIYALVFGVRGWWEIPTPRWAGDVALSPRQRLRAWRRRARSGRGGPDRPQDDLGHDTGSPTGLASEQLDGHDGAGEAVRGFSGGRAARAVIVIVAVCGLIGGGLMMWQSTAGGAARVAAPADRALDGLPAAVVASPAPGRLTAAVSGVGLPVALGTVLLRAQRVGMHLCDPEHGSGQASGRWYGRAGQCAASGSAVDGYMFDLGAPAVITGIDVRTDQVFADRRIEGLRVRFDDDPASDITVDERSAGAARVSFHRLDPVMLAERVEVIITDTAINGHGDGEPAPVLGADGIGLLGYRPPDQQQVPGPAPRRQPPAVK